MRNKERQQVWPDSKNSTHRKRTAKLIFTGIRDIFNSRRLLKHQIRLSDHLLTQRRCLYTRFATLEQSDTQFIFKFFNGDTESGLTDKTALCGFSKMLLLCQGDDIAQLSECHEACSFSFALDIRVGYSAQVCLVIWS